MCLREELKYLTQKECEIIIKLRTEHVKLNHYLFTIGIIKGLSFYDVIYGLGWLVVFQCEKL